MRRSLRVDGRYYIIAGRKVSAAGITRELVSGTQSCVDYAFIPAKANVRVIGVRIAGPLIDARSIFFSFESFLILPSSEPNRDGRGNALTSCRPKPLAAPATIVENDPAR